MLKDAGIPTRLLAAGLTGILLLGLQTAPTAQAAAVGPSPAVLVKRMTPDQIIKAAEKISKTGVSKRYAKIQKSAALVALAKKTVKASKVKKYLRMLAAMSTDAQISRLLKKTKGKHFEVTRIGDSISVKIVKGSGPPKVRYVPALAKAAAVVVNTSAVVPKCWQAWAAWAAWFAATEAICGAVSLWNPVAVAVCALVFGLISFTLIDFNDACKDELADAR